MQTTLRYITMTLMMFGISLAVGCGPSALSSGNTSPTIQASGWTNGNAPVDIQGKVVVLEVFATW